MYPATDILEVFGVCRNRMGTSTPVQPQGTDDLSFQHYSRKHRIIAWVSMHLCDGLVYRQRHGLIKGLRRRGGLGWLPIAAQETAESRLWRDLDLTGRCVYDIGAFHGLLTMHFSSHARVVVAYEPSSANRKRLQENLSLNNLSAIVRPVGLGSVVETRTMHIDPLTPGGSSVDESATGRQTENIQVTTLDEDIAACNLPAPEFVKIDVEGFEREVLLGGRQTFLRFRPDLFLEMHGETMAAKRRKVTEIVAVLEEYGYRRVTHIRSGTTINNGNCADVAPRGHLYCRPLTCCVR